LSRRGACGRIRPCGRILPAHTNANTVPRQPTCSGPARPQAPIDPPRWAIIRPILPHDKEPGDEDSNRTQTLYTTRAPLYERLFVNFLGWGRELDTFFRKFHYLQPNMKILDAGCGTGIVTRTLYHIAHDQGYAGVAFHAFDLTPAMLAILRTWVTEHGATNVELQQADVLALAALPAHWHAYDLIVVATMLECLPKTQVPAALHHLKQLLRPNGILLVFLTRRTFLTKWLGERWWKTQVYDAAEMQLLLRRVGFGETRRKDLSSWWRHSILVLEVRP